MPEKTRVFMVRERGKSYRKRFRSLVEKLVYGGDGLGASGWPRVVLTPYVLPGERVRVRAEREKPGLVRARLLEVLSASPERVRRQCPYFSRCGGCHYQHAPYERSFRSSAPSSPKSCGGRQDQSRRRISR
jgi:tRNA/tmRNA/rRNA uracil-C5-methylase (TrmA/RlmC/RlmD family)